MMHWASLYRAPLPFPWPCPPASDISWSSLSILLECFLVASNIFGTDLLPPTTKLGQGNVFTGICDSVHKGGLPQCMLGYHPPAADPPQAGTPPWSRPPRSRHPPPMLGDTVNARAVSILLECNLVK